MALLSRLLRKIMSFKKKEIFGVIPKSRIKIFLPDAPIVLEGGAHIGTDTIEMGTIWPMGMIHAFEPVPSLYTKLKKNTQNYNNIITYPLALSSQTGEDILYISSGTSDGSSSLLPPKEHLTEHPDVVFREQIKIPTVTLDDWVLKNNIPRLDFLWLDLQGHELSVLKAGTNILDTVTAIYTEVSLKDMYNGGSMYPEIRQWLAEHGFRVEIEELPWPDMGNVLFVR
jgi:FkbM family methyltransferase